MTFPRYLRYRLKASAIRTLAFAVISVAITTLSVKELNDNTFLRIVNNESGIGVLATILGVFALIIPILETACFKSRRNLDTLYSLPIKRKQLALAHYLSGLIQLFAVYSVTLFTAFIYLALNTDWYDLAYLWLYYAISLLFAWIFYSLFIFIFNAANSVSDGTIFVIFWIPAIAVVWLAFFALLGKFDIEIPNDAFDLSLNGILYYPFGQITNYFKNCIECNVWYFSLERYSGYDFTEGIAAVSGWTIAAFAATYGYFRNMLKKGAEEAGEISSSWLGFKLLSPLYGYSCIIILSASFSFSALWTALIITAMAVGYIIKRKSFKLKVSDCIMLGIGVALSAILSLVD